MATPEFDENDAFLRLNTNDGEEFVVTRHNAALYTFGGKLAIYNHVFVGSEELPTTVKGIYIFNQNPSFAQVSQYMIENAYPMHLNLTEVAQCDLDAFEQSIQQDVGEFDSFPTEWDKSA